MWNDSFYRSLDREPDVCFWCRKNLKAGELIKCYRCEKSNIKNKVEYDLKHWEDCECSACNEKRYLSCVKIIPNMEHVCQNCSKNIENEEQLCAECNYYECEN